ncbi:DUF1801 domain-containing protein [Spongiimicrobium salis]|uniref:DUF1801 domain-containing protein n=1 Tax=Spongiimicrobium salis TaxID=1667022 RepID=UPI00374C9CF2
MKDLILKTDPRVDAIFDAYPEDVRQKMQDLRAFIVNTAKEHQDIGQLEETLKWGEPSFLTKNGSTIRMDWKAKKPHQYALYFQCTSKLVPTFRMIYKDTLSFEGNRAITFQLSDTLPLTALKACLRAALTYHKVKHLPSLGI